MLAEFPFHEENRERLFNAEELTTVTELYLSLAAYPEKRAQFVNERQATTKMMIEVRFLSMKHIRVCFNFASDRKRSQCMG